MTDSSKILVHRVGDAAPWTATEWVARMTKRRAQSVSGKSVSLAEARNYGVGVMTELTQAELAKELDALNQS